MTPGPTIIRRCAKCAGLLQQRTLATGNTRGAKYWTDGEMQASMLPRTQALIRCPHCGSIAWLKDFVEIDSYETDLGSLAFIEKDDELKADYEEAMRKRAQYEVFPYYEHPSAEELFAYPDTTTLSPEKELQVRVMAWRTFNNVRRDTDQSDPLSSQEVKNLSRVVQLLDQQDLSLPLLKGEALRELGFLDEARRLIEDALFVDEGEEDVAQFILDLINVGDTQVREITKDDSREWRSRRRLLKQYLDEIMLPEFDPEGPPVFTINSRDWWIKVLGMLCHNWALIDVHEDQSATVYFFHDQGTTKRQVPDYDFHQLKGRCAVVDSLDFQSINDAKYALRRNGFNRLEENPGPWDGEEPIGTFFDARRSEKGTYSKAGYWV